MTALTMPGRPGRAKLVLLGVVVAAAAGGFSALFSWYLRPFSAAGYAIPFATDVFDLREVAFPAWTLAAFAIGALAGMLIRRVVPAIAATLTAYAGLALATALYLRQHYMTPLLTSKLNLPGSAWIVSQWYAKDGKFAFGARGSQMVGALRHFCPSGSLSPAQCLTQHGYTWWARYEPGSRFWPFQLVEGGWLLALSVLLIAATAWLVRRRAA
jgi:hypothetical protein